VPACPGYHEGAPIPGCYRDHVITIPSGPGVDNGFATVRVEWPSVASDYDIDIYKDANGNGVVDESEEASPEGSSAQGTTDFEQVTLGPDPSGKYIVRVVNFAAGEPYNVNIRFAPPTLTRAQREVWTLTCETHSGRVLERRTVYVARGQAANPSVGACITRLERSCRRGLGDRPTGRVRGNVLDRIRLGRSRSRNLRTYRFGRRRRGSVDRFCLSDGRYVRAGYPSSRLRRTFGRSFRRRYTPTKAVLVLTTSKRFRIRKVRVGSRLRTLRRRIGRVRGIRVGRNVWYLKSASKARLVFKVRRGRVLEVGIADKRLTSGRRRAKRFLSSFR